MKVDILTLFPEMFKGPFDESIVKRAQDKGLVKINVHNLRNWAKDRHKTVDDKPYGGGTGMILKVDIIYSAIQDLKSKAKRHIVSSDPSKSRIILLDAGGTKFTQKRAWSYSKLNYLLIIAGHYEGVDYRVRKNLVDDVISIGDYVLTGGEIPAMVIVDSVVRLIPGVLEKPDATKFESFSTTLEKSTNLPVVEYPQYTRPENFKGWKVPKILVSGDHAKIEKWRKIQSLNITKKYRPDLTE